MKMLLFCFTDAGAGLAIRLCEALELPLNSVHSTAKLAEQYGFTAHNSVFADMQTLFYGNDALVFIGACSIAVRAIAPYLRDKTTDPAVLVIDQRGSYVIPVLSGHIGGANALAERIAAELDAAAVITTATDTEGRFSCDAWAAANDCAIVSMESAKAVSSAILTQDIPVSSEYALPDELPNGLTVGNEGAIGIYIGTQISEPYERTLRLVPRVLNVGVGCRRGTPQDVICSAIRTVFEKEGFDLRAVKRIASVDIKSDEEGLLACAEALGAELVFYTADELNEAQGEFSDSAFVRETVGTGCVCERAAVLAGGDLIVKKTVVGGVTVAVAKEKRRLVF